MNEDQARKLHAQELVAAIRRHAADWMRADALSAPYDGHDALTESARLALWRLGYGHLDPTGQPEPAHLQSPPRDEVPTPAIAAHLSELARTTRAEAAAIQHTDPIAANILRAKADMITESLFAAGYDETGKPGRRS